MERSGILLLLVLVGSCGCRKMAYAAGTVVPNPLFMDSACTMLAVDPITFRVEYNREDKIVGEAVLRLFRDAFTERNNNPALELPLLTTLRISSNQVSTSLFVGVNEDYNISFCDNYALVSSHNTWGALRGLETLSQMIFQRAEDNKYVVKGCGVRDSPALAHRGIVVDVATSHVSLPTLFQLIDSMSYVKLNVLTLQLTNDENFAFGSEQLPQLQENRGRLGNVFPPTVLEHLKRYAHMRGVVLSLRIDMPGGTSSWLGLYDVLLKCCSHVGKKQYVQLNPTLDLTYTYISKLLREIAGKFPGSYIDFGSSIGDFDCWAQSNEVIEFMKKKGFGNDFGLLAVYFYNRIINETKGLDLKPIVDSRNGFSSSGNQVSRDAVLMLGGDRRVYLEEVKTVLGKNYNVIFAFCTNLTHTSFWDDPHLDTLACLMNAMELSPEELHLIVGGSAHLNKPTDSDLLTKVWVKGFSMADLFWNFHRNFDMASSHLRYYENKCRFFSRNIPVRDVDIGNYCHHEFKTVESHS